MANDGSQNSHKKFICEICDYKCCKKNDMTKHLSSRKHNCNKNSNTSNPQIVKTELKCDLCNKIYKSRVGLWRHKKTCVAIINEPPPIHETPNITLNTTELLSGYIKDKDSVIEILISENKDFKNIILELVKNNGDLQKQLVDVCKNSTTTNIQNTNSHNNNSKTFNLQVFLNEKCKDAMNIMDFVNSMTLELSDLEDVGELGYVEGISKIMIRKLNELDVYKRPIHCSDAKREIMYVRDENVWAKENSTYDKIRKAIKHVSHKNSCLLGPWSQKYPDCMNNQHRLNDVYVNLIGQAMGGRAEFVDSENKIMKKIAKAVLIDK
jgi:hypothetical protein